METAPRDLVGDDETLYRCVQYGCGYYEVDAQGRTTINTEAFADPEKMPSVDRAEIRQHNPARTQIDPTDGILILKTADVRRIGLSRIKPPEIYEVDVIAEAIKDDPDGLPDNDAHAKVRTDPPCAGKVWKRLKAALARLAETYDDMWAIKPPDVP